MTLSRVRARLVLALLPVALIAAVACSDDKKDDQLPSPVAGTALLDPATNPTITFTDNKYNIPNVAVKTGTSVTVTFNNKGAAVHNWHVTGVKDTEGKEVNSGLINGGKSGTATFAFDKPGTYTIQCDVHPADMRGSLTVQ